jgi:hypothetical protein
MAECRACEQEICHAYVINTSSQRTTTSTFLQECSKEYARTKVQIAVSFNETEAELATLCFVLEI